MQPIITAEMSKLRSSARNIVIGSVIITLVVGVTLFFLFFLLLKEAAATQTVGTDSIAPSTSVVALSANHMGDNFSEHFRS